MLFRRNAKWYQAGLHFQCRQCGNCCGGFPGYVWVTPQELQAIADFLEITADQCETEYLKKVGRRKSLIEKGDYDCVFLERTEQGVNCSIYPVRPKQCRTWPFWNANLTTSDNWNSLADRCGGINRGKLHTCEDINKTADSSPC